MSEEIWRQDACEIARLVKKGDLSAKEVLETFLERIESLNPQLNAFVYLDPERARAEAGDIDRRVAAGEDPGSLAGVPIGVKDLEDVAGMPTTHGSVIWKDHVAETDSIQVARLREAGCIVVGKTAAPEFGSAAYTSTRLHGTTRNPWNLKRTPGGSSGGSAAAVAAGLVPLATASDGGGSTRIPASYTGLFGPKGTFGRVPRGRSPESSYTSVHGPITRSVRDAARFYDSVMGSHETDQFSLAHPGISYEDVMTNQPKGLRATWSATLGFGVCASEVEQVAKKAADQFASAGAFGWINVPVELRDPAVAWVALGAPESWNRHSPYWEERGGDLDPIIRLGIETALQKFDVKNAARAHARRWENNQTLARIFDQVDLIVTPTTATTAFAADGPMPAMIDGGHIKPMHAITFTYPFNVSGHPAVSVPCGFDSDGLPVGLQFVARRHQDHTLIGLAAWFESFKPWAKFARDFE